MLLLVVAKLCKDSLPDSCQSHLDIVRPGSSLDQQTTHKKWMQAQHAADRSFRMLHAGSVHHHIVVVRSMLLIAKLLLLMHHAASSSEALTASDVLWQVLLELKSQLLMRKPHVGAPCPCCERGKWYYHGIDAHMSVLLAQQLLCLLRKALTSKQGNAGLCCSILAGLTYTGVDQHVLPSVAFAVRTSGEICYIASGWVRCGIAHVYKLLMTRCCRFVVERTLLHSYGCVSRLVYCPAYLAFCPGGLAALALALDGDRAQAKGALDAIRYCLEPNSATSPEQINNALVLLARMKGVLRCSVLLCPPVGNQDQGNWVETGRQPLLHDTMCVHCLRSPLTGSADGHTSSAVSIHL